MGPPPSPLLAPLPPARARPEERSSESENEGPQPAEERARRPVGNRWVCRKLTRRLARKLKVSKSAFRFPIAAAKAMCEEEGTLGLAAALLGLQVASQRAPPLWGYLSYVLEVPIILPGV